MPAHDLLKRAAAMCSDDHTILAFLIGWVNNLGRVAEGDAERKKRILLTTG